MRVAVLPGGGGQRGRRDLWEAKQRAASQSQGSRFSWGCTARDLAIAALPVALGPLSVNGGDRSTCLVGLRGELRDNTRKALGTPRAWLFLSSPPVCWAGDTEQLGACRPVRKGTRGASFCCPHTFPACTPASCSHLVLPRQVLSGNFPLPIPPMTPP